MSESGRVLVATDAVDDANLVRKLLSAEFDDVKTSVDPARAVTDFESVRPDVLVLAFDSLEKSERHYLGLYRLSSTIHAIAHRTLILCGKDDVMRVYDLCKRSHFDDYVLFWPMSHDAPRLPMSVLHLMRLQRLSHAGALVSQLAARARALDDLAPLLDEHRIRSDAAVDGARRSVAQVRQLVDEAAAGLGQAARAGAAETAGLAEALRDRWKQLEGPLAHGLQSIGGAIDALGERVPAFARELEPHVEAIGALRTAVAPVPPLVLLVDDEPFQHQLLRTMLRGEEIELLSAHSGAEALVMLQRSRPDAILMDLGLPDLSGVDIVRRVRATPALQSIPIVMITGNADRDAVVQSMRAGATGFLVKPVGRDALIGRLRQVLGSERMVS